MRIAIVGAGAVGRSIANALLGRKHKVLLIEQSRDNYRPWRVPDADWMLADTCEMETLERAGIETCDAVMAASGDDQVNLVFSLLAKTESGVRRVVARINDPDNEWMFTYAWGVDVAVSAPRAIAAGVEEAATVDDIVRLITLRHGQAQIMEIALSPDTRLAGTPIGALPLPAGAWVLTLLRDHRLVQPHKDTVLRIGDQVLVAAAAHLHPAIRTAFGDPQ